MKQITDDDLYDRQYDVESLAYSVKVWTFLSRDDRLRYKRIRLYSLLRTQKLTGEFCVRYILNGRYSYTEEEHMITDGTILRLQPHISKEELTKAWTQYGKADE
jgi:hypothetical protein